MTRDKITKELDIQEEIEGDTENLRILRHFLGVIKWSSQWNVFTTVKFHRYGQASYETYRLWYADQSLIDIYKNRDF